MVSDKEDREGDKQQADEVFELEEPFGSSFKQKRQADSLIFIPSPNLSGCLGTIQSIFENNPSRTPLHLKPGAEGGDLLQTQNKS